MNRDIYAYNFIVRRNLLLVFIPLNKLAAAVICIEYNPVVCYCKQEAIFIVVVCCFLIVNMYTTASVAFTALALTLQELHTTSTPAVEIVVAFTDLVCSPSRGVIFTFS